MTNRADTPAAHLTEEDCRLADLIDVVSVQTDLAGYPKASTVEQNVLIYDSARLREALAEPGAGPQVAAELARALHDGPGIVVFAGAFPDAGAVDRATEQFEAMIAGQRAAGGAAGDHFAAAGQNDRIWNALEKLALRAPEVFAAYYANEVVAAVCRAWLGPGYQVTSQVNVVNPGGAAQTAHRDYHLGFQSGEQAARYPRHVHRLSPVLTLQGAVAHSDMPVETGPTRYLPHSQKYLPGYLAGPRPEFREYFEAHHVQLPLRKGDAVFFNPALLHAAGTNRSAGVHRMANLLQVSSAFGRAMEAVDRARMSIAVFPALTAMRDAGAAPEMIANVIAACAEGYPFPTNLDLDPPADGLAPPAQADILGRAVADGWPAGRLQAELAAWSARRQT
ncbi:MAG TPA: phytanoyl-CoA dioxygenase family protein [Streptosporangiaceae bacterium]|jgi:ectoine hydroxylase-related dioxygenase (phytanoyl-CoA dioxygenase family)|nr:phytanoyl-CoA dioxygenase family protein [Streptosporangiaceae bacterium]